MTGRATILACALVVTCGSAAHAALDDATVRERTRAVLSGGDYQTERPSGEPDAPDDPPPPRLPRSHATSDPVAVQAPSSISQALIWIVLGGIAVFVLVLLIGQASRSVRKRRLRAAKGGDDGADAPDTTIDLERLDETLRAALALAAQGRFEEAVHRLLTGAIADLQAGAGLATEVALTSRELLAAAKLRSEPQAAFRELVFAVEVSLFGGLAVGREDFERCVTSFRTLRQAVAA